MRHTCLPVKLNRPSGIPGLCNLSLLHLFLHRAHQGHLTLQRASVFLPGVTRFPEPYSGTVSVLPEATTVWLSTEVERFTT